MNQCKANQKWYEKSKSCISIPKKSYSSSSSKSNNPFKMWGSYLVALPGIYFIVLLNIAGYLCIQSSGEGMCGMANAMGIVYGIPITIIGFLIGWGLSVSILKNFKNPFKMLETWIGLFVGILFLTIASYSKLLILEDASLVLVIIVMFLPLIGFLIGWGVHSLIRRHRK